MLKPRRMWMPEAEAGSVDSIVDTLLALNVFPEENVRKLAKEKEPGSRRRWNCCWNSPTPTPMDGCNVVYCMVVDQKFI